MSGHHGSQNDWHLIGKATTIVGAYGMWTPGVISIQRMNKEIQKTRHYSPPTGKCDRDTAGIRKRAPAPTNLKEKMPPAAAPPAAVPPVAAYSATVPSVDILLY